MASSRLLAVIRSLRCSLSLCDHVGLSGDDVVGCQATVTTDPANLSMDPPIQQPTIGSESIFSTVIDEDAQSLETASIYGSDDRSQMRRMLANAALRRRPRIEIIG